ncbi:MAG: hypothetical protein HOJ21_05005 [Alphaproteobacteria bacterium]|jgi:hypothetical protein|nr:hypothetical protein [Alphaproteobacteria bacterium]
MALPNLIVAGAPKCGTSSLFQWIADHPEAEGARIKETCYFNDPSSHVFSPVQNFALMGLAGYEDYFPVKKPNAKVRLEATPTYMYQQTALAHLPDLPTTPKFLFVVRDPAAQLLSTYRYYCNNWLMLGAEVSFGDFIEMVENQDPKLEQNELLADAFVNVRYCEWLDRWQDRVGHDRMRVLTTDALSQDRSSTLAGIAAWLGLDPDFYRNYAFPRENESYRVKNRTVHSANVRLRGLIAKTPLYKFARTVYRRINTESAPATLTAADKAVLGDIRRRFANQNAELAAAYNLDISHWSDGAEAATSDVPEALNVAR